MQIRSSLAARYLLLLSLVLSSLNVFAFEPTPAQIDALMRLAPAQQAQLAQKYGVDLPQGSGTQNQIVTQQVTVQPRSEEFETELNDMLSVEDGDRVEDEQVLKPFGYDLFAGEPTTFTPIHDIPVSSDYMLGPGDTIKLNLYGKENQFHELLVDNEGKVYLPELGPLSLAGLNFSEAKEKLNKTISQKVIGVKASISMGELRSIRVFVLGEAYRPGSYVVSSLSTITNALVLSGGIAESGSLRNIQLKRRGELVATFDLYDLLLKGDTRNDLQLKSGDVVFIPPVNSVASVEGEVKRPAIYELIEGENLADLVAMAGGYSANAYPKSSTLTRLGLGEKRVVVDADLSAGSNGLTLKNGDHLLVSSILEEQEQFIKLTGHVQRPGLRSWKPGMRVSDVISNLSALKNNPDSRYAIIKRYLPPKRRLSIVTFNLEEALSRKGSEEDVLLSDQDEIVIFSLNAPEEMELEEEAQALAEGNNAELKKDVAEINRREIVDEIIRTLRDQTSISEISREVEVTGDVKFPGVYPLVQGMNAEDLIYAAGGLTERAFKLKAELSRSQIDKNQQRQLSRFTLDLSSSKDLAFKVESRDVLQIKTIPDWQETSQVTLSGEVMFPGVYTIHKDDTLFDVLERAGGFTQYAYLPGAVFTREELKEKELERIQEMQRRLEEDIAKAQIVTANSSTNNGIKDISQAQSLLDRLKDTPAVGRLVIDLEKIYSDEAGFALPVIDGDELFVPMRKNSVIVIGEVQMPISQVYDPSINLEGYINKSGGMTDKADEDRIYIVKANGGVKIPESSSWFIDSNTQVEPGDTVVVPLDTDDLDQLVLWRDISQVFYQIALGVAAVGSF